MTISPDLSKLACFDLLGVATTACACYIHTPCCSYCHLSFQVIMVMKIMMILMITKILLSPVFLGNEYVYEDNAYDNYCNDYLHKL